MKRRPRFFMMLLLCAVVVFPYATVAKSLKKTVKNPKDQTANDLQVCTTGGANNTTQQGTFTPPAKNGNGSYCVKWPAGSGSVSPGGSVDIKVNTSYRGKIDDKNTYLTRDDVPMTVSPCKCEFKCNLECCSCQWVVDGNNLQHFFIGQDGAHYLTIENHEPVPVAYTNVQVWLNNDNTSGQVDNLDLFDVPTGVLSALMPSVIELDAFQDSTFFLEGPLPDTYDLFLADEANSCHPSGIGAVAMGDVPVIATGVRDEGSIGHARFELSPGVPNPFNPVTAITYRIPNPGRVRLAIYDVSGRLVATLVDEVKEEGRYTATWDGLDSNGAKVASGAYYARLEHEGKTRTRTVVMIK